MCIKGIVGCGGWFSGTGYSGAETPKTKRDVSYMLAYDLDGRMTLYAEELRQRFVEHNYNSLRPAVVDLPIGRTVYSFPQD